MLFRSENNQHQADGSTYLGPGRSAGYAVFNLSTDYRPTRALQFFAQVNNLFNRRYNTASQLGAAAFDANANFQARPLPVNANGDQPLQHSTFFAPGAPRTLSGGAGGQLRRPGALTAHRPARQRHHAGGAAAPTAATAAPTGRLVAPPAPTSPPSSA